jgi:hypothetical protein
MSRLSAIDGAEWCERWRSDDRRPASDKDTQPEEQGGCARGAGLLCKQTMVGSLPTFSTTRESHDSNAARSTARQDGGARRPAAIPAIRVRPQAGPEPASSNERREVTGGSKSNTEVLLVPAMHVFEAHHRRQQAGETRGACLPASQQPTSSPRRGRCSAGRRTFIQCMTRRSK